MKNFKKLFTGVTYEPLLAQIKANPQLWNENAERKYSNSPHLDVSDIWVRFRDKAELKTPYDYAAPHVPTWYPSRRLITEAEVLAMDMMALMKGVQLGCVLITKIPPGGCVLPHHDRGRWNAEFMNTKLYIPIAGNKDCINECEGEHVNMMPGEVWSFDNLKIHSVENNGTTDRITLIVCLRTEP